MLRQLFRACLFGVLLLLGIPAATLILARVGLLRLPDPYLRSVTEGTPAPALEDYERVLGVPDTIPTERNVAARAAITESAAHMPGHRAGLDRAWSFYRVRDSRFRYGRERADAYASGRAACDDCSREREAQIRVSALVTSLEDRRASVVVRWSAERHRTIYNRSGDVEHIVDVPDVTGELTVTLEASYGKWRAVSIEPRQ